MGKKEGQQTATPELLPASSRIELLHEKVINDKRVEGSQPPFVL